MSQIPPDAAADKSQCVPRAIDAAMERDQQFFAQHPDRSEYIREIIPNELWPLETPPVSAGFIRVVQIRPGIRVRLFEPKLAGRLQ
jgi:hypothetical protein